MLRTPPACRWTLTLALALLARPGPAAADPALHRRLCEEDPARVVAELSARALSGAYDAQEWIHLAQAQRYRCDLGAARAALLRVLARDPFHAEARAALGEAQLLEAQAEEALRSVDLGLAAPQGPTCSELWRVRCLALTELRRYEEAEEAGRRAAALAPADARVAEAMGRASFQRGDMAAAGAAYRTAAELDPYAEEATLRLGNGFGPGVEGRPWEQGAEGAAFWAARLAFEAGALDDARDRFAALVRAHPDTFKYRLGLGSALAARRRALEARGGPAAGTLYALLPAPEIPDLTRVLPDYARLSARDQHVVRVTVAPLRPWWPALVAAGALHDFLPLAESLGDREPRADLRGRVTFDGRHYDHLRGVGGLQAATGVEKLGEAADLTFHTFAHELAHQVLTYALPVELAARVKALYARAVVEGRCLDYYAASNVDEYFAQGYEAFVSHLKRGCLKETQRHVRAELRQRDPALYAFFVEILDLAHETPEALAAFEAGAQAAAPPAMPAVR